MPMTPEDALRRMVKSYPGGLDVVALRVGKPAETLRKELACAPGFKLGLGTATLISDMCIEAQSDQCMAFVNAIAAAGGGYISLPVLDMPPSTCVQKSMSMVIQEMSHVSMATIEGDADGVISDNDLQRNLREICEARQALQQHEHALRLKHAAGKRGQA